jgi:hypothetical protein
MGKGTSTVDLGHLDGEVAESKQRAVEAVAYAVHAELLALTRRENHGSYRKCELLAQVRKDELHAAWAEGFGPYAVRFGFTTSERLACAMASLWVKLQELPELRAVFQAGRTGWTLIRDAADLAAAKLATDAELAKLVATGTYRDLRALKRRAQLDRGQTPTVSRTLELREDTDARLARVVALLSHEARSTLGRPLTLGEGIEHMLALVEQVLHTPEPGPAAGDGPAPVSRCPEPLTRSHLFGDPGTFNVLLHGPDGLVKLSRQALGILGCCDREVQDEDGKVTRTVPRALRRKLWERDRGCCQVPGCRRTRYLHLHHEGEGQGGYLQIGHDPDRMFHLCTTHHLLRHQGWLRITGRHSTGFRFFRANGEELTEQAARLPVVDLTTPPAPGAHVGAPASVVAIAPPEPRAHVGARTAATRQVIADVEGVLVRMEYTRREARVRVDRAVVALGPDFTAEALIVAALHATPG